MADIGQFLKTHSCFISTFKETSYDTSNDVPLCQDALNSVINFDAIVENRYPNAQQRPKSFDALYIDGVDIYCVEFKNQKPSCISSTDIREKLEEGKKELDTLLSNENIQKNDYDFTYCVVYQNCLEPRERYKCDIKAKILFDLSKYKGKLVKNVITRNVDFFTKQFKKNISKELDC